MANKQKQTSQKSKQKLSAKQKEQRRQAAEERARREAAAKARKERTKRIFTIVICVILVLALGIPTIALSLLGTGV